MLEVHGSGNPIAQEYLEKLLSRDPKVYKETKKFLPFPYSYTQVFITSGQHMTERTGGSDVGNSETIAIPQKDGSYALHGYKFFTSATTSAMAVVLARIVDENGKSVPGEKEKIYFIVSDLVC